MTRYFYSMAGNYVYSTTDDSQIEDKNDMEISVDLFWELLQIPIGWVINPPDDNHPLPWASDGYALQWTAMINGRNAILSQRLTTADQFNLGQATASRGESRPKSSTTELARVYQNSVLPEMINVLAIYDEQQGMIPFAEESIVSLPIATDLNQPNSYLQCGHCNAKMRQTEWVEGGKILYICPRCRKHYEVNEASWVIDPPMTAEDRVDAFNVSVDTRFDRWAILRGYRNFDRMGNYGITTDADLAKQVYTSVWAYILQNTDHTAPNTLMTAVEQGSITVEQAMQYLNDDVFANLPDGTIVFPPSDDPNKQPDGAQSRIFTAAECANMTLWKPPADGTLVATWDPAVGILGLGLLNPANFYYSEVDSNNEPILWGTIISCSTYRYWNARS